jgi:Na+/H+ antiporter NhaD/arsenite permease-like protein
MSLAASEYIVPHLIWTWPFACILLAIAVLPLMRRTHHWWEENRHKLLIAVVLGLSTLLYYQFRGYGVAVHEAGGHTTGAEQVDREVEPPGASDPSHAQDAASQGETPDTEEQHLTEPGLATVQAVLNHAVLKEYVPFITLLFSLYVIAGGIVVRGDVQATPLANTTILGVGGLLASLIGTTGASMVLIRLLLKTNAERKKVVHTVVFFIFIVSNIGGTLLPTGDPPLFLGYLRGVEFFWTLGLWKEWAFLLVVLLGIYYAWDTWAYRHETKADIGEDIAHIEPMRLAGTINMLWLVGVVVAVATLDPGKAFPGTTWHAWPYMRECVQFAFVGVSLMTTPGVLRKENQFNYVAIGEVACLFIGIFITMQVPIEILNARGAELGLHRPWHFFWATGILSSFLDNAPTYVVFFETARTLPPTEHMLALSGNGHIDEILLVAISCGAVFMGANSYIGNGPNFMVKTIAEQSGVKMPSFFGFMAYAAVVLIPVFVLMTFVFFRG